MNEQANSDVTDNPDFPGLPAAVLLLCSNRELALKRRDLIRPDLNKQYASLCNRFTPVSSFLFGDELNKEVEE